MQRLYVGATLGLLFCLLNFTACQKDEGVDFVDEPEPITLNNPDLPANLSGTEVTLKFTNNLGRAPFKFGQEALFTFSEFGEMFIDSDPNRFDGNEIEMSTLVLVGSDYQWEDTPSRHRYTLVLHADERIKAVNVSDLNDNLLGQFTPLDPSDNHLDLVKYLAGTYSVDYVDRGIHTRRTITIEPNGNIDFDDGVYFTASDYQRIRNNLNTLNRFTIHVSPYPSYPSPMLELILDKTTWKLSRVLYLPKIPGWEDAVTLWVD